MTMHSCLYEGFVRHRRYDPVTHCFQQQLYMAYLDLDELQRELVDVVKSKERFSPVSFRRSDHFGSPHKPLTQSIRELVGKSTGRIPQGPIRLLTQLRVWGHYFSPLNMFYCFDQDDAEPATIVAEVSNTPWMERHMYVLWSGNRLDGSQSLKFSHPKSFHVSPFMGMDQIYNWSIGIPGDTLQVGIHSTENSQRLFSAALSLKRRPLNRAALRRLQIRYPLITLKTVTAIYFQALRLWKKNCPFYPHPKKNSTSKKVSPPGNHAPRNP